MVSTRSKAIIIFIILFSLCLADQPLVDKKKVEVEDGKTEMVPPDEIQRLSNETNDKISNNNGEIKRLRSELESLKAKYNDLERRVRALE